MLLPPLADRMQINGGGLIQTSPLELQRNLSHNAEAMRSMLAQQAEALKTAEATFQSFLSRAFSGDHAVLYVIRGDAVA